jgi:hypothetical protein
MFESIIHDHVTHFIKFHPNQLGFTKSKSIVTNLVTFLDFITPVVRVESRVLDSPSILVITVLLNLCLFYPCCCVSGLVVLRVSR